MIGRLPTSLEVNGKDYCIRTDFRVALTIFQAWNDPDLSDQEKAFVMLECLYEEIPTELEEAGNKAVWFLDGGPMVIDDRPTKSKKVMDWEQDEQIIFSAINKVAGYETREKDSLHWWTFLGFFNEIGEGLLSNVINIRNKKNKGKKLEKHEQEFYKQNKAMIDLKSRLSQQEKETLDEVNKLLRPQ